MEDIYVLGVDIGGSHIACQLVNLSDCSLIENTYAEVKVAENQSAGIILAAWEKALKECMGKAAGKIIRGIESLCHHLSILCRGSLWPITNSLL